MAALFFHNSEELLTCDALRQSALRHSWLDVVHPHLVIVSLYMVPFPGQGSFPPTGVTP